MLRLLTNIAARLSCQFPSSSGVSAGVVADLVMYPPDLRVQPCDQERMPEEPTGGAEEQSRLHR